MNNEQLAVLLMQYRRSLYHIAEEMTKIIPEDETGFAGNYKYTHLLRNFINEIDEDTSFLIGDEGDKKDG